MFRRSVLGIRCLLLLTFVAINGLQADENDVAPQKKTLTEEEVKKLVREAIEEDREKQKKKADEAKKKKEEEAEAKKLESTVIGAQTDLKPYWRDALHFKSADNVFKVHVGGRMHTDMGIFNTVDAVEDGVGGVGPLQDGVEFRRARIRVNGSMWENVHWLMEYGFESGVPAFFDVYTEMRKLPYIGTFRVGHFREPFSMDALTSGNNLAFIERSLLQDSFVPFRNTGILATNLVADNHLMWAFGVFRSNSNLVGDDTGDRNYALTGRLTYNAGYDECNKDALHLGIAGSHRNLPLRNAAGVPSRTGLPRTRLRSRPEIRANIPFLVNTGFFQADQQQLIGLELGYGSGPFLFQAEYVASFLQDVVVPGQTSSSAFFHGFYVQASYFLTGEHRAYNQRVGMYDRAKPHEDFFWVRNDCSPFALCGLGAWEVGARYSYLDLTDNGINGGILEDVTLGLNWHLNQNCRWMFNYILAWREVQGGSSDGLTRILGARFQIDF